MKQFFLWVFCLLCTTLAAQSDKIENQINDLVANGSVEGLVAGVVEDDQISWIYAAGQSGPDKPFSESTLTRIASIVKPMTAVAIMQLVEKGKLDLDAPITDYLPEYPQWEQLTTRYLLSHTSGIDAYKNDKEAENMKRYNSLAEAIEIFKDRPLRHTPGEDFTYTTYGYVVLGRIIEAVSGVSYREYIRTHIFVPSEMNNTYIYDSQPEEITSGCYVTNGKGKIREDKVTDLSDRIPGGGMLSTAEDVLNFANAFIDDKLITEESRQLLLTDTGAKTWGNPYGMGWYLYGKNPRLGNTVGHTGSQAGCSAQLFIFPERDAAVVVLANTSQAMGAVSNLAVALFELIDD